MKTNIFENLHDSIVDKILIDKTISKLEIYLTNIVDGLKSKWLVSCFDIMKFNGASRFTIVRDHIDVYDLVEIEDIECLEWKNRLIEMGLKSPKDLSVKKLYFASGVFDGANGEGGIEIICRRFTVQKI